MSLESAAIAMPEPVNEPYLPVVPESGARSKVLLVEDDPANALVATTFLENLGYEYDTASNGQDVLAKMKLTSYAVVLMDVNIPGIDGLTATQHLRSMEQEGLIRVTPIIAMTAHAFLEDRQKCLSAGMNDYISKPFSQEHLDEKLRKNIRMDALTP